MAGSRQYQRLQKSWKEIRYAHATVDSAQNHQIDTVFPKLPGVVKKATKVASSALVGAGLSPFYAVVGAQLGISKAGKAIGVNTNYGVQATGEDIPGVDVRAKRNKPKRRGA
jgi:hypothetical protein